MICVTLPLFVRQRKYFQRCVSISEMSNKNMKPSDEGVFRCIKVYLQVDNAIHRKSCVYDFTLPQPLR